MQQINDPLFYNSMKIPKLVAMIKGDEKLSWKGWNERVQKRVLEFSRGGVHQGAYACLESSSPEVFLTSLFALFRLHAVAILPHSRWTNRERKKALDSLGVGLHNLESIKKERSLNSSTFEAPFWNFDQPATLVFTSGSTGTSKAALLTLGNHIWSAWGAQEVIPLFAGDRWLLSLPLYHVGGLAIAMRCVLSGATMVLPKTKNLGEEMERHGVTHCSLVPTQLHRLLEERRSLSSLKACLIGGAPCGTSLRLQARKRGFPVHYTYGMTETASQVTTTRIVEEDFSSGELLKGRELRFAEDGEILVRGKTLFQGYLVGGHLHTPFSSSGWFPTGDLGRVDAEGRLYVEGRKDQRIISGGENIQPEEVELALEEDPEILRACVVGREDEEFGSRPVAFLAMKQGVLLTLSEVRKRLEDRLAAYKHPTAIFPWPQDVPVEGKLYRNHLKSRLDFL